LTLGSGGILEGITEGSIYLDLTTSSPALIRRVEPMFREKGASVLDAPVMASPAMATMKDLMVLVGGQYAIYEQVRPLLQSFADRLVYAGSLGMACVCKLVNNMMTLVARQIIAEGLTLGVKSGANLEVLLEILKENPLGGMCSRLSDTVISGQFEPPGFTLALSLKDIAVATELGRENNVPMVLANMMEQIAVQGMNRGWASKDDTILFLLQEEMTNVNLKTAKQTE